MNNMAREIREIDTIKSLIDYIQRNLKKGYKLDQLRWALINQGHSRTEIERAMKYVTDLQEAQKAKRTEEPAPEVLQEPPKIEEKKSAWKRFKEWFLS